MKRKKTLLPLICAAVFLVASAGLRYFNIFVASAAADVSYNSGFVSSMDILHDVLLFAAYGFSVSAVVYSCRAFGLGAGVLSASLMSAVVFADRAFCFIYDIAVSNINIRETGTVLTAVTWLFVDFLFYAAMYFGGVFISCVIYKAYEKRTPVGVASSELCSEKNNVKNANVENKKTEVDNALSVDDRKETTAIAENKKSGAVSSLAVSVGIMTLLQLVSQLVICVQFFMEYDDVTATEKAQMAGDILWILVEYGGILAAFALIFYAVVSAVHGKVSKKS